MNEPSTFWLVVLGLLTGWLLTRILIRWSREARDWRSFPSGRSGQGFDTSAIAKRIRKVREHPLEYSSAHAFDRTYREAFLASTRRVIRQLPFFRHEPSETTHPPAKA
jgi:hypothetical protein